MTQTNPDPTREGKSKKRRTARAGDERALQRTLWRLISEIERRLCDDPEVPLNALISAAHGVAQLSLAYLKVIEQYEYRARLEALERRLADGDGGAAL